MEYYYALCQAIRTLQKQEGLFKKLHVFSCKMQVHLGVLRKNEQHEDDMLEILEWLHPYVPGHDEKSDSKPVNVLSGGDYLTFERHKEAQSNIQDARTPSVWLEGLIPKIEDFHSQAKWLKVGFIGYIYMLTLHHWTVLRNTDKKACPQKHFLKGAALPKKLRIKIDNGGGGVRVGGGGGNVHKII